MIYQVWGIEAGDEPPQILLESFRLGTDAEAKAAADAEADAWRKRGATEVKVVPVAEKPGDDKAKVVALFKKHLEMIEKEVTSGGWTEEQQFLVGVLSEEIGRIVDNGIKD